MVRSYAYAPAASATAAPGTKLLLCQCGFSWIIESRLQGHPACRLYGPAEYKSNQFPGIVSFELPILCDRCGRLGNDMLGLT
jgi:hypothetical protein